MGSMRGAKVVVLWVGLGLFVVLASVWALQRLPIDLSPARSEVKRTIDATRVLENTASISARVEAESKESAIAGPAEPAHVDRILGPDQVALPTIGGREPNVEEGRLLRILAHAMCEAGLSYAMPEDLPTDAWALLVSWVSPMREERSRLSRHAEALVSEAIQSRLANGIFTEQRVTPASWPDGVLVGWRHAKNSMGQDVVQVVRIESGEMPTVDFARERVKAIDTDMAAVARSLFDRVSR